MSVNEALPNDLELYSPAQLASLRALGVSYQALELAVELAVEPVSAAKSAVAAVPEKAAAAVPEPEPEPEPEIKATPAAEPEPTARPELAAEAEPAAEPVAEQVGEQVGEQPQPVYIRLGSWLLYFCDELPVQGLPWMRDLELFLGGKLSRVSAPSNPDDAIDLSEFARLELSASEKRALWHKLSHA